MNQLTWAAQAAIAEQRRADRPAEAAADRLAGQTRTRPPTTAAIGSRRRTWRPGRSLTSSRPVLAGQPTATTS